MAVDPKDPMMVRPLIDAGVRPGMWVLDVGCGRGDVSLMVRDLVGPDGHVRGVDRDPRPLSAARERARDLGLDNVAFDAVDLGGADLPPGPFDVVVGRRVLMYLPDPADVVRRLATAVRPGGLIVFQESDATITPAGRVPMPLHERVHG